MYSQEAIAALTFRIGWEKPLDLTSSVVLDIDNVASDSARKVNSFHQLATVENLYAAVSVVNMEMVAYNAFLATMRHQSVLAVLNDVFDKHIAYDFNKSYTNDIILKATALDDAIGYTVAIQALELFVSSNRKNLTERNPALSFQALKIELEGAKNDRGFSVAKGLLWKRWKAIRYAQDIFFIETNQIIGSNHWE